ncbi:hypothetical protein GOP47_0027878 [Adiantum capillus-veneris]|nr:hypothetical protein GOP47_0027878 [Adiantum capillus-veneris]
MKKKTREFVDKVEAGGFTWIGRTPGENHPVFTLNSCPIVDNKCRVTDNGEHDLHAGAPHVYNMLKRDMRRCQDLCVSNHPPPPPPAAPPAPPAAAAPAPAPRRRRN